MSDQAITVRRIEERRNDGIHETVIPPLEQSWDDLTKLHWKAAVANLDTGLNVRILEGGYWIDEVKQDGYYSIQVGNSSSGPHSYRDAWKFINGVVIGAQQAGQS